MNIIALVSRDWSKRIIEDIMSYNDLKINLNLIISKGVQFDKIKADKIIYLKKSNIDLHFKKISSIKPDLILAYGWSHYLSKKIRNIAPCLILHPSKLPLYRGGSPIQNQIINGEVKSAVTILFAEDKIDSGDILFQKKIDFTGYLDDIFDRIVIAGVLGTRKILKQYNKNKLKGIPQNNNLATIFKRRTPAMSKISAKDFKKYEAKHFYNLIRGLQHPYPECFVECKNNTKLYLKKVYVK